MKLFLINVLLVFVSTCVAFLLCEALLRVAFPQDLGGWLGVYTKSGLAVNRSSGTALHQLGARRVEYHFASPHLRDLDSDLRDGAPSLRVLVVGDSFTFGWLLADRDSYVRHLEDYVNAGRPIRCQRSRFLDAAVAGWGAADYTVYLREYLPRIRPDYVLVFVNTDDIGRALKSPLVSFQEEKLTFRIGPRHRFKALLDSLPYYNYLLEHSEVAPLARKAFAAIGSGKLLRLNVVHSQNTITVPGNDYPRASDSAISTALGEALFNEIIRACNTNHAKLIVLTTGYMKFMTPNNPSSAFYRDLPSFLAARGVPFLDISKEFEAETRGHLDDYLIPISDHPNERGAALVASLMEAKLKRLLAAREPLQSGLEDCL